MTNNENDMADEVPIVKRFAFHRSYWESGRKLSDVQRHRLYDGIINFAFTGEIPQFEDDFVLDLIWTNVAPNVSASVQRSLDGGRGGRPRGNGESKKGTKKGTSKGASKASSKVPNKSETPIPIPSTPIDSTPILSSPASSRIEEGGCEIPFPSRYDDMSLADSDIEF